MTQALGQVAAETGRADAARALAGRLGHGFTPPVEEGSVAAWVSRLQAAMPPAEACAVLEHLFGVLPLLASCFELGEALTALQAGRLLGALGFATPTPDLAWESGALSGEPVPGGVMVRGELRIAAPEADGALILVRLATGGLRLAWLDHAAPGVERRASRAAKALQAQGPWLHLDGIRIADELVSAPVTLAPGSPLRAGLARYAGAWAYAAVTAARSEIHALRRAARTTLHAGKPFNAAQGLALALTEVEIEADLTAAAARRLIASLATCDEASALAVATAAARVVERVAGQTEELSRHMGWEPSGGETGTTQRLRPYLGGASLLAAELGRSLGIREPRSEEGGS